MEVQASLDKKQDPTSKITRATRAGKVAQAVECACLMKKP
jgi:hypothetical protein